MNSTLTSCERFLHANRPSFAEQSIERIFAPKAWRHYLKKRAYLLETFGSERLQLESKNATTYIRLSLVISATVSQGILFSSSFSAAKNLGSSAGRGEVPRTTFEMFMIKAYAFAFKFAACLDKPASPAFDIFKCNYTFSSVGLFCNMIHTVLETPDFPMRRHLPQPLNTRILVARIWLVMAHERSPSPTLRA